MRWLWQRTEHRASATDALVAAIVAAAGNQGTGDYRAIAALETAAGLYAAAFASARVVTDDARVAERLTPAWLAMVARSLIRRGEFLAVLEATPARGLELLTAGSWDVRGGPAENLNGGTGPTCSGRAVQRLGTVPSAAALHVRYAVDPSRPWRGLSPLESACATGVLAGNLEQRLGEETGAAVGGVHTHAESGRHRSGRSSRRPTWRGCAETYAARRGARSWSSRWRPPGARDRARLVKGRDGNSNASAPIHRKVLEALRTSVRS